MITYTPISSGPLFRTPGPPLLGQTKTQYRIGAQTEAMMQRTRGRPGRTSAAAPPNRPLLRARSKVRHDIRYDLRSHEQIAADKRERQLAHQKTSRLLKQMFRPQYRPGSHQRARGPSGQMHYVPQKGRPVQGGGAARARATRLRQARQEAERVQEARWLQEINRRVREEQAEARTRATEITPALIQPAAPSPALPQPAAPSMAPALVQAPPEPYPYPVFTRSLTPQQMSSEVQRIMTVAPTAEMTAARNARLENMRRKLGI